MSWVAHTSHVCSRLSRWRGQRNTLRCRTLDAASRLLTAFGFTVRAGTASVAAMAGSNMQLLACALVLLLAGEHEWLNAFRSVHKRTCWLCPIARNQVPALSSSWRLTLGTANCTRTMPQVEHACAPAVRGCAQDLTLLAAHLWQGRLQLRHICNPGSCFKAAAPLQVRSPAPRRDWQPCLALLAHKRSPDYATADLSQFMPSARHATAFAPNITQRGC